MLKTVLIASDLSARADIAVSRGLHLAKSQSAEALIVHVVDEDQPTAAVRHAREAAHVFLAEQLTARIPDHGSRPEIVVETGDPAERIVAVAAMRSPDLVVMGAHRRRGIDDVFVGTTIERVMRTGQFPVLMAQVTPDRAYRKVLIAVDMSEPSGDAAEAASRLGLLDDAEITFVHAYLPLARGAMIYAGIEREVIEQEIEKEIGEKRRDLSNFLSGLDIGDARFKAILKEGPASRVIFECARSEAPDLLVIGSRGHSGLKRILLGSVAQELLRGIGIDTLVVHPKDAAASA